MTSAQQKDFCVLQLSKTDSVTKVQRNFRRRFGVVPPLAKNIRRWHRQFEETGCLCKGKSPGRPRTLQETVQQIQQVFGRSPRKSTRRCSKELAIPHTTVWRVLTRRLGMKPYRLQLVQKLRNDDKGKRMEFSNALLEDLEDDSFLPRLIFSDEATFHLSGKVNRHNVRIWGLENPRATLEHERDFPKVNVFVHFHLPRFMVHSFLSKTLLREGPTSKCCVTGSFHRCTKIQMILYSNKTEHLHIGTLK